jgi:hypothetical protein
MYRFTEKSRNIKIGEIPVTTSAKSTCPEACPLKNNGCYADGGPLAIVWKQCETIGIGWIALCEKVQKLPSKQLWRHNQAGDLPGNGDKINVTMLNRLVKSNAGRNGFTYTHKPMIGENKKAVKLANKNGFTINLSGNDLKHARKLKKLNIAPVVSIAPLELERQSKKGQWIETTTDWKDRTQNWRENNADVTLCPATNSDIKCIDCKLCAIASRETIVAFPAHGFRKNKANKIACN